MFGDDEDAATPSVSQLSSERSEIIFDSAMSEKIEKSSGNKQVQQVAGDSNENEGELKHNNKESFDITNRNDVNTMKQHNLVRRYRHRNSSDNEKPIEKLKRFLRSVRIIVEVCLTLKKYVKESKGESPTLAEMQMNIQEDFNKQLTFNPHYFNASYVANKGSSKLKKLLSITPAARNKRHVKLIHTLVENKSAFSKYPVQIRMRMCQVMIYQHYEQRRVIIKQGHPPSAFYILLSGSCLINAKHVDKDGTESNQTVNEAREGEVFGEVALLNNSVRTASVVCKTDVELLVIYKDDFDAIIRGPLYRQREEVVQYCRSIPLLSDWPVHILSGASVVNFHFQYYRRGCVVMKNTALSNFLVFIKSGECRIVCALEEEEKNKSKSIVTSRQQSAFLKPILPLLKEPIQEEEHATRNFTSTNQCVTRLPRILNEDGEVIKMKARTSIFQQGGQRRSRKSVAARGYAPRGVNGPWNMEPPMRVTREPVGVVETAPAYSLGANLGNQRLTILRRSIRSSIIEDTPYTIAKSVGSRVGNKGEKRRMVQSLGGITDGTMEKNKRPPKSTFAQIAVLRAGCTFGLEEMMRRTKLRTSLISDGAECIFISRKMFLKHASPKTLRCLNSMIGKYPTDEFIRHQLSKQVVWKKFREDVMKDVLQRREEKLSLPAFLKAT